MSLSPNQAFSNAYGMSAVGMLISWMCFGGTTAQVSYYFQNYPKDKMRVKLFVLLLFALDIVKEANTCNALWYRVVTHRGDVFIAEIWTSRFYIWNFWILSRRTWLRIALTAIALLVSGGTWVVGTRSSDLLPSLLCTRRPLSPAIGHGIGGKRIHQFVAGLHSSWREEWIPDVASTNSTDNLIGRLITFVVNRGILLFILQLLEVVLVGLLVVTFTACIKVLVIHSV
ncbi:uncharacterized protein C8Q71DRAFT_721327 [Rhodofomes roseus]|uniref:Uncharacterized protein n=1 Tax=Rhodofomes roseus TaxID=34475 RepID=A0ABQ8KQH7_9APHY|nr:uncharacterized protein C8Q71DRAFT_721327 [Rhodofomes roseus]KAH9840877.1 hypothetical protein C8Q71DRAFT_721327 [Rhodofomes roseus]